MLDLFVPDSGELDQHPAIQELLAREQPRSFQIVDHPCWYETGSQTGTLPWRKSPHGRKRMPICTCRG